ncbi:hypothetical protein ACFQYP_07925 [Nonomuraea antimicrobica]
MEYAGPGADVARESLGGALDVAGELGTAGDLLAAQAQAAFTESLLVASAAGAVLMLAGTLAVWLLTPRDLDVSSSEHHH